MLSVLFVMVILVIDRILLVRIPFVDGTAKVLRSPSSITGVRSEKK